MILSDSSVTMRRTTESHDTGNKFYALRFDVIGKTLETLMDKQLMKTTVNNELSSKKYAGKKRCFEIGKLLIIPLKTFFGDTLGGGGYAFAFCSKPIPLQAIMPLKIAYEGTQER